LAAYTPGSDLGYALGVAGALMMLALFAYPLRKRLAVLQVLGPLRFWFGIHMAFGLLGPALILAHSRLQVGSLNAAVALGCMLLVAGSGVAGRFIYRQIHHGLYGRKATLAELREALARHKSLVGVAPTVQARVDAFEARAARPGARAFMTLWLQERAAFRDCRRELRRTFRRQLAAGADRGDVSRRYVETKALVAAQLRLTRGVAHFETYERLFSLWHVLHIPFVWMLVASAVIHVVAVHMY
jgi:hypothetical protein